MSSDSLGDRMKENYEKRNKHYLTRRTPVIIRVDGKAFHTVTRNFNKPFDTDHVASMQIAAALTAKEMQGFKLAYTQSDECSFLITDFDRLETNAWFDYNQSKLESITSSIFAVHYTTAINFLKAPKKKIFGFFDARAFNLPGAEIVNYFLWRAKDWERNSISMYCGHFHSHKEMHGKNRADMHEMLHQKGKNWTTDLKDWERNGSFITKDLKTDTSVLPLYLSIDHLVREALTKNDSD